MRKRRKVNNAKFNTVNGNIGWAAYSWNPVTGCKNDCPYCYAREIGNRFNGHFNPTIHNKRLTAPRKTKVSEKANNRVFVCSMAELFGDWVPDKWINIVLGVVRKNPQWTFLFLTKNPKRLLDINWPTNAWIGATIDRQHRVREIAEVFPLLRKNVLFISCEPLLEKITLPDNLLNCLNWLIVGAKSEGQKKIQPEIEWVESLFNSARKHNIPVWFKDNLIFKPQEIPKQ